jgi:hypothetical protein
MEPRDEELEFDINTAMALYKQAGIVFKESSKKDSQKKIPKAERKLYFGDIPIWRSFDKLAGHWIYYLMEKYSNHVVFIKVHLGYQTHVDEIRDNLGAMGMFSWIYLESIENLSEEPILIHKSL